VLGAEETPKARARGAAPDSNAGVKQGGPDFLRPNIRAESDVLASVLVPYLLRQSGPPVGRSGALRGIKARVPGPGLGNRRMPE